MADGSTKPIETIQPGDLVLAADEHDPDGPIRPARVVETYHNTPKPLLAVSVAGPTLRCTFRHPFYVKDKGWTAAEELQAGDLLRTSGDE